MVEYKSEMTYVKDFDTTRIDMILFQYARKGYRLVSSAISDGTVLLVFEKDI